MATFSGFGELQTPKDLLRKLEHDFARIAAGQEDDFATFDFFVTAEHIVDWLYPSSEPDRRTMRSNHLLVAITSHLASGSKHFVATHKHHKSVASVRKDKYFAEDYAAKDYVAEPIVVKLSPTEAKALGASEIEAITLAKKVLDFWKLRL